MGYEITRAARSATRSGEIRPQLLVEIEGYDKLLTSATISEVARFDDDRLFDDGWSFDSPIPIANQDDLISLDGTTNNITQQLRQDEGGVSSTSNVTISLVNKDNIFASLVRPSGGSDIISKKASIWLGQEGTSFPEDFIRIFVGNITQVKMPPGLVQITVSHPEHLKRAELFQKISTELEERIEYRSAIIQDLTYRTRSGVDGTVTIQYVNGIEEDEGKITVTGNNIVVSIFAGITKASTIRSAIESDPVAAYLVVISVSGDSSNVQTETSGAISLDSSASVTLLSTEGMLTPSADGCFKTYVRINDEIIQYTGINGDELTGCTRGALETFASVHEVEDTVDTFYVLGDATADSNAITLALKVLISGSEQPWLTGKTVESIGSSLAGLENSFLVSDDKLGEVGNLTAGDFATITGASYLANNVTDAVVAQVIEEDAGTRVVLTGVTLAPEELTDAVASFSSQYATLPDGVGMTPDQVDIAEFKNIFSLFSASIPNYMIYLKDTINGKDLVNKEILFPAACYSLPRKGRVSIGKARPPIAESRTEILDDSTVLNPGQLSLERSVLENFYNAVVYKFEEDVLEDKKLQGRITLSAMSTSRIKSGNKPFVVESKGLRKTNANEVIISNNARSLLERYQFGAETLNNVRIPFGIGWNMEVGDSVIVQGLQVYDTRSGQQGLATRVFEVQNRAFNFRQGVISLSLLDTTFSATARYGVISPSSQTSTGSTETRLLLKKSFGTGELEVEQEKWLRYVGLTVQVHDENWTEVGTAKFTGFDPGNMNAMLLEPGLGFSPGADYIVTVPPYDHAEDLYKATTTFMAPQGVVTADSANQLSFEVDDPTLFFVDSIVLVHSPDYSVESPEVIVTDVTGNVVTVGTSLEITPLDGYEVDLIGFASDQGIPYRLF